MKELIEYNKYVESVEALDMRIGHIDEAEVVSKNGKFIKLTVDFGEEGKKIVVTNLGHKFEAVEWEGRTLPFIINMPEREISGHMSQAMILVGDIMLAPGTKIS